MVRGILKHFFSKKEQYPFLDSEHLLNLYSGREIKYFFNVNFQNNQNQFSKKIEKISYFMYKYIHIYYTFNAYRDYLQNLLQVCERIPTIGTQLKILSTVKATMLGAQGKLMHSI